jgi:eukaryotic-like serine/threonine-protein kinase
MDLASGSVRHMDHTDNAGYPFWAPDSQSIGFFTDDKLRRVSLAGGAVQTICDVPRLGAGTTGDGATWNQDGVILYASYGGDDARGDAAPLMQVPAGGGEAKPATALGKDDRWHAWPQFLPDGRHFLYFAPGQQRRTGSVYIQELGSPNRVLVMHNQTRAAWAEPGYVLFNRDAALLAQRINSRSFQLEGEPLTLAQDVTDNPSNGRSAFNASNRLLVFSTGQHALVRQLTWRGRDGAILGTVGKPVEISALSLSPKGNTAALAVGSAGGVQDLWQMDLATGVTSRVTAQGKLKAFGTPVWSPDSQRLAITELDGVYEVAAASGKAQRLTTAVTQPEDWLPDGASVLCLSASGSRVELLTPAPGATPKTILDTPYRKGDLRISPDGKWVAYYSYESGSQDIYAASFPSFEVKRKISSGHGYDPAWNPNGRELFYRSEDGALMSVDIRASGSTLEAGIPKALFTVGPGVYTRFVVADSGKRFLTTEPVKQEATVPELSLLLNWWADLK